MRYSSENNVGFCGLITSKIRHAIRLKRVVQSHHTILPTVDKKIKILISILLYTCFHGKNVKND